MKRAVVLVALFFVFSSWTVSYASTITEEYLDYAWKKTTPHVLDIAILGDRYTDMNKFRTDVEKFKTALLTHEPFKSRAHELLFHVIDNAENLDCASSSSKWTPATCNDTAVLSALKNASVPADKIFVLVDGLNGGGAVFYAIAGNGAVYYQEGLFVHEFAHIFGLMDEYLRPDDDYKLKGDYCQTNCCFSALCADWTGISGGGVHSRLQSIILVPFK